MPIAINGSGTITGLSAGGISNAGAVAAAALPSGTIKQVVQATTDTVTEIATNDWTDATNLSVSITPSSASSKVMIMAQVNCNLYRDSTKTMGGLRLLRGSTTILQGSESSDKGQGLGYWGMDDNTDSKIFYIVPLFYLDSPNTTSATTYKIQAGVYWTADNGKITINYNDNVNGTSTITAMEVAA